MRLTIECENNYYPNVVFEKNGQKMLDMTKQLQCNNKLGQLEDIEDELGIDLLLREKALQDGCWYKSHSKGIVFCPLVRIVGKGKALELKEDQRTATLCAKTCDYGKTWALTKEELE